MIVRIVGWGLAAALCAWALVRGLGLERGYPLVPLVAFTPYVAGLGVLVVAFNAFVGSLRAAFVALAAVGVLAAGVVPRVVGGSAEASGAPLRVMTLNAQIGGADPEFVVDLVRRRRVDVLSAQELTPGLDRALERAGLRKTLPHAVLRAGPGGSGTGIYSRFELTPAPGPRGTQNAHATARIAARDVEIVSVHPPPPIRIRIARWRADLRRLPAAPERGGSRILAGDFNATLDHRELRRILDRGYTDAADAVGEGWRPTWPVGRHLPPEVTIDHVLIDRRWAVSDFDVVQVPGTDHRAVLAVVRRKRTTAPRSSKPSAR